MIRKPTHFVLPWFCFASRHVWSNDKFSLTCVALWHPAVHALRKQCSWAGANNQPQPEWRDLSCCCRSFKFTPAFFLLDTTRLAWQAWKNKTLCLNRNLNVGAVPKWNTHFENSLVAVNWLWIPPRQRYQGEFVLKQNFNDTTSTFFSDNVPPLFHTTIDLFSLVILWALTQTWFLCF